MSFKTWLGCTCKRFECNGVYLSNMRMRETMNSRGLWSLKKKMHTITIIAPTQIVFVKQNPKKVSNEQQKDDQENNEQ